VKCEVNSEEKRRRRKR